MRTLCLAFALALILPLASAQSIGAGRAQQVELPVYVAVLHVGSSALAVLDGCFFFRPWHDDDDDGVLPMSALKKMGPWFGPLPLGALNGLPGGQTNATVGTTGCWVMVLPLGGYTGPYTITTTGGGPTASLSQAVAEYKEAIDDMMHAGMVPVPCSGGNPGT